MSKCWQKQATLIAPTFTFMHLAFESVSRNSWERNITVKGSVAFLWLRCFWNCAVQESFKPHIRPARLWCSWLAAAHWLSHAWLVLYGPAAMFSAHAAELGSEPAWLMRKQASLHHVSPSVSPLRRQVVNAVLLPVTASETLRECIWEHAWVCLWKSAVGCAAVVFYLEIGIVCVNRPFPGFIRSVCARLCAVVRAKQCVTLLRMAFGGKQHFRAQIHSLLLNYRHLHEFKPPVHQQTALTTSAPDLFMGVSSTMGTFGHMNF